MRAHLVSAPVPDGGGRLTQKEARPGNVGVDGVPKHGPRVLTGQTACVVRVDQSRVRDGILVLLIQAAVTANFIEPCKRDAKVGG